MYIFRRYPLAGCRTRHFGLSMPWTMVVLSDPSRRATLIWVSSPSELIQYRFLDNQSTDNPRTFSKSKHKHRKYISKQSKQSGFVQMPQNETPGLSGCWEMSFRFHHPFFLNKSDNRPDAHGFLSLLLFYIKSRTQPQNTRFLWVVKTSLKCLKIITKK